MSPQDALVFVSNCVSMLEKGLETLVLSIN